MSLEAGPSLILILPVELLVRSPVIKRVPIVPAQPGLMLPWLTKLDAPVPATIVPVPDNVPILVKPFGTLTIAPDATLIEPV